MATEIQTTPSLRQMLVLGALASRPGAQFAPVQVQKLLFLIDENISSRFGGKQFAFDPYDYGPFDKTLYHELDWLAGHKFVQITQTGTTAGSRRYSLTPAGQDLGAGWLSKNLDTECKDYVRSIANWVCGLTFAQLVGSIYKAYPQMRANSIFKD